MGNSAPDGPDIYNDFSSTATVTYSDVQGDCLGTGNIDSYPVFVNPAGIVCKIYSDLLHWL